MNKPLSSADMDSKALYTAMGLFQTWTAIKLQSNREWKREITEFSLFGEIKHF